MRNRGSNSPSTYSLITYANVLLTLILIGIIVIIVLESVTLANTVNLNNDINNQQCNAFDQGRAAAFAIGDEITLALNLLSIDPYASADVFISNFAETGSVWSTTGGNFFGAVDIKAFYLSYALFPGETNQTIVTHNKYWDPKTSTLSLERNWTATLTAPRLFTNYTTFVPNETLNAGTTYTQDDFVIIRFECIDGIFQIVYYREYFDSVQSMTFYTTDFDPVCEPCPAPAA